MRFFEFIFLERVWSQDKDNLDRALLKMRKDPLPVWLLIFPEGTIVNDKFRKKNKEYAEKIGLQVKRSHYNWRHSKETCLLIVVYILVTSKVCSFAENNRPALQSIQAFQE
jgi:1-acyl-sn-glycerol-3-phosphate acyltransferase